MAAPQPCAIDVQDIWGPRVKGCGTNFDLTLLFQESILAIGPLCIAICSSLFRVWQLRNREVIVASRALYWSKVVLYLVACLLQIALLIVQGILKTSLTRATYAVYCLTLVGFVVFLLASHYEHTRTVRPSTVLLLYLLYSIVADALRARTLWSMPSDNTAVAATFTVTVVCKAAILLAERTRKTVLPDKRDPTPDEQADIFSQAFLWWIVPLFILGKKKTALTAKTLPGVEPDMLRPMLAEEPKDDNEPSLSAPTIFHHLFRARKWLLLTPIVPRLIYIGFKFSQPFLVYRATAYMYDPEGPNTKKVGGGLIGAYAIVYVGIAASQAFYRQCTARVIAAVRADLVGKIHSHTLKLSASSSSRDSASMLMSADVERFAAGSRDMHECWACVIELALGLWLLEDRLGVTVAATGGLTAFFIGLTGLIVKPAATRQNRWLKAMEGRIAATTQALSAMKGVKMTGIAEIIRKDLSALRDIEAVKLRHFRYVLLVVAWAAWIPVIMAPIMGFTIYSQAFGHPLTPPVVYRCLTIFTLFGDAIAALINSAIQLVTSIASLLRIQEFLLDDNTRHDSRHLLSSPEDTMDTDEAPLLPGAQTPPMQQASGDTMLLRRLSRRLSRRQRAVTVQLTRASAGWNAETPSIVQNADLDVAAPTVLAVVGPIGCGKTTLLQMLLGETRSAAGSVSLSKSRIGYCSQMPWLVNDTVRDNIVGSAVFDETWYNSVVRATALDKDFKEMMFGDSTMVANEGASLSGGQKKRVALARAIYSKAPIMVLDDPFNGLDGRTEAAVLEAVVGRQGLLRQQRTLVVWATSSAQQVRFADKVISLDQNGTVRKRDSLLVVPGLETTKEDSDQPGISSNSSTLEVVQEALAKGVGSPEAKAVILASAGAHRYYVRFSGRRKFLVFLVLCAIFVFGMTFNQYWIQRWSENTVTDPGSNQRMYVGVYFGIGSLQLVFWTAAAAFFVLTITQRTADRCHDALLDTILGAPMSFFDSTAAGETINRFSQDMQLIDTELPYDMLGTVTQAMIVIGMYGIIIYSSPWSGCAIPAVIVAAYYLQLFYLPTSRQLRVLEIEAKAPLFSNFIETLNGLATIRALGWTADYARRNLDAIRVAQQPFYLLFSAQNWLNLILDLITAGLAVTIMCVGVATRSASNASIGLALFSASNVGVSAKQLIQHWTKLETSMAAVERVRFFTDTTPSEENSEMSGVVTDTQDRNKWHGEGRISFRNVSARYSPSAPLVLRDVSFDIQPGQRFAICGRTGSGKSTLLGALLRLINLHSGSIHVDGIDISTLKANDVRSRFITLPQEPVLITGTVRHNMQLYEPSTTDEAMIGALSDFGLWDTIQAQGGLDETLTEGLLSHGQRQLFCFARSTLQKGNIVILDEPTSQSDRETEQMLDQAIRERFNNHTVLCIAHKLNTILSFDTVVVMAGGAAAESGNPRELLEDQASYFSTLMRSREEEQES
ncbi:P-loop containing nucleoside triphosphate hydrolase protein [Aspergillus karnatakaensis]|uniref:P-loop containing nucleoside triphosphate hydrolase protein n=1 Tax=Aspergillus karnatakaensis TaxID=1810916 RepID=UPI003CCD3F2E